MTDKALLNDAFYIENFLDDAKDLNKLAQLIGLRRFAAEDGYRLNEYIVFGRYLLNEKGGINKVTFEDSNYNNISENIASIASKVMLYRDMVDSFERMSISIHHAPNKPMLDPKAVCFVCNRGWDMRDIYDVASYLNVSDPLHKKCCHLYRSAENQNAGNPQLSQKLP